MEHSCVHHADKKSIKQRVKFEFEQLKFRAAATKEDGECMITIN